MTGTTNHWQAFLRDRVTLVSPQGSQEVPANVLAVADDTQLVGGYEGDNVAVTLADAALPPQAERPRRNMTVIISDPSVPGERRELTVRRASRVGPLWHLLATDGEALTE